MICAHTKELHSLIRFVSLINLFIFILFFHVVVCKCENILHISRVGMTLNRFYKLLFDYYRYYYDKKVFEYFLLNFRHVKLFIRHFLIEFCFI